MTVYLLVGKPTLFYASIIGTNWRNGQNHLQSSFWTFPSCCLVWFWPFLRFVFMFKVYFHSDHALACTSNFLSVINFARFLINNFSVLTYRDARKMVMTIILLGEWFLNFWILLVQRASMTFWLWPIINHLKVVWPTSTLAAIERAHLGLSNHIKKSY